MRYAVCTSYSTYNTEIIELPDGRTWDDVDTFYVKWGTLHITYKGSLGIISIDLDENYDTDTKRPSSVDIRAVIDGNTDQIDWELDPVATDN